MLRNLYKERVTYRSSKSWFKGLATAHAQLYGSLTALLPSRLLKDTCYNREFICAHLCGLASVSLHGRKGWNNFLAEDLEALHVVHDSVGLQLVLLTAALHRTNSDTVNDATCER